MTKPLLLDVSRERKPFAIQLADAGWTFDTEADRKLATILNVCEQLLCAVVRLQEERA